MRTLVVIVCHVAPVLRAVRRAAAFRPRPVAKAAIGATIRRTPRPVATVCRDAGLGALLLATVAASPLPDAAGFASAAARDVRSLDTGRSAPPGPAIAPLWSGPWGGFPPPTEGVQLPIAPPGRAGDLPVPPLGGEGEGGNRVGVPEPSSIALFAAALLAAPLLRRRYGR